LNLLGDDPPPNSSRSGRRLIHLKGGATAAAISFGNTDPEERGTAKFIDTEAEKQIRAQLDALGPILASSAGGSCR
jgi:hypothetical protein